jgi:uncharacterized protein YgiM (DUF1202 family)
VGAGPGFILAGKPLPKGTVVEIIEQQESGWSKVASLSQASTSGWVCARYLAAAS